MKATFNEFITRVKTVGLPSPTHFHIIIPGETKLNLMMCESITFPGFSVMTEENRVYGELSELPTAPIYNAVTATFIMDNNAQPRTFFVDWLNQVFNRNSRQLGYYNDYTKLVEIYITNKGSGTVMKTVLHECYPKSISDIELSYSGDHLVKFTVSFIYKWASELVETSQIGQTQLIPGSQTAPVGFNLLNKISQQQSVLNNISGLPVGGILQNAQQSISTTSTNEFIPLSQLEFDQSNLAPAFNSVSNNMISQVGTSQSVIFEQTSKLQNSVLSQSSKDIVQIQLQSVERDVRVLAEQIRGLNQDENLYVDTYEQRQTIGDAVLGLTNMLDNIRDMFQALDVTVELSALSMELTSIGQKIKNANSAVVVNQQLASFGQVFQAIGAEIGAASNEIQPTFSKESRTGVDLLSAQFMQIGINIQALQVSIP